MHPPPLQMRRKRWRLLWLLRRNLPLQAGVQHGRTLGLRRGGRSPLRRVPRVSLVLMFATRAAIASQSSTSEPMGGAGLARIALAGEAAMNAVHSTDPQKD